jgi:hypothetical protein
MSFKKIKLLVSKKQSKNYPFRNPPIFRSWFIKNSRDPNKT